MNRHQNLYKENGILSSRKERLNRERNTIRAKERCHQFLARRNISVSPTKTIDVNLDADTNVGNKENVSTPPQRQQQASRIALLSGKSIEKRTRQEKFLQKFVEWKGKKKIDDEIKKRQREMQPKPFLPVVGSVIGVSKHAASTIASEGFSSKEDTTKVGNAKRRKSVYTVVSTPPRRKEAEKGAIPKKVTSQCKVFPVLISTNAFEPRTIVKDKTKTLNNLANLTPVFECDVKQFSKQTQKVDLSNKSKKYLNLYDRENDTNRIGSTSSKAIFNCTKPLAESSKSNTIPATAETNIEEVETTFVDSVEKTSAATQSTVEDKDTKNKYINKITTAPVNGVIFVKTEIAPISSKTIYTEIVPATVNTVSGADKVFTKRLVTTRSTASIAKLNKTEDGKKVTATCAAAFSAESEVLKCHDGATSTKQPTKTLEVPKRVETASVPKNVARFKFTPVKVVTVPAKPSQRFVKTIRSGEEIVSAKTTFARPLPPLPKGTTKRLAAKPPAIAIKASGNTKTQMTNKHVEGVTKNKNAKLSVSMKAKKPSGINSATTKALKHMSARMKLNTNNLLEVPQQDMPVAETPTDLTNINPFGFFVTSTKRKSSAYSFKFLVEEKDENEKEIPVTTEPIQQPETPPAVRKALEAVNKFRKELADEIVRLHKLCEKWELYKSEQWPQLESCCDGIDIIDATVGQTKLLTSKKFMQFSSLIDRCEKGVNSEQLIDDGSENTKPITPVDLEGYWTMLGLQVDDIDKRFKNLDRWRLNNWIDPDAIVETNKAKLKNRPIKKMNNISKSAKPSTALLQMMRKMNTEMRNNKAKTESSLKLDETDKIHTPLSKRRQSPVAAINSNKKSLRNSTSHRNSTPSRNSTPRRTSLIVKDKKFYSASPTVLVRQSPTLMKQNSTTEYLNSSKQSPKHLVHRSGLLNSLKKLEKVYNLREDLLKSTHKEAEKRRLSIATPVTPILPVNLQTAKITTPFLNTPRVVTLRKSILKTPGTAKGKPKNVVFEKELSIKKFKFTIDSDDEEDRKKLEAPSNEIDGNERTYHLRGRKVYLRPSSEFEIPKAT